MDCLLLQGDCIEVLRKLLSEGKQVDSIVTDPPYELGFMNKGWDKKGIAFNAMLWYLCLQILKPGGHLLAFGGSRTYHRMTCAIEDAGFEIRDQIMWVYGSGFPKSHNISKAIDKMAGAEREVVGTGQSGKTCGMKKLGGSGYKGGEYNFTNPATDLAKQWEGWGTALKPAHEPIVVARKPLSEKTVAHNVLEHGTGAINVDECRVPMSSEDAKAIENMTGFGKEGYKRVKIKETFMSGTPIATKSIAHSAGRWPANLIHDGSQEVLNSFPETHSHGGGKASYGGTFGSGQDVTDKTAMEIFKNDKGSASRFFYCAKDDVDPNILHESIVVARKPLSEDTVAENVLEHGTGAINIDECRVSIDPDDKNNTRGKVSMDVYKKNPNAMFKNVGGHNPNINLNNLDMEKGRWPANLIHDGSDAVEDEFAKYGLVRMAADVSKTKKIEGYSFTVGKALQEQHQTNSPEIKASASRFFYCAKASKKERNIGLEAIPETEGQRTMGKDSRERPTPLNKNNHPTVKPIALMKYLCRLVTPPGGTVLDPFMGSGSTGIAAKQEGFNFIGIDNVPEYVEIAKLRIEHGEKND